MGRGALVIFWDSKFDKMSLFGSLAIKVIFVGLKRIPLCSLGGGGMRINLYYFWEVGKIVEKRYIGISS